MNDNAFYDGIVNVQEQLFTKRQLRTDAHVFEERGEVVFTPEFGDQAILRMPMYMVPLGISIEFE